VKEEILSAGVSELVLDLFHDEIFKVIAADAPTGFLPGQPLLSPPPIQQDLPLNFEAVNSILYLEGTFVPGDAIGGVIPNGTLARVYSQNGLHAQSAVDSVGSFSLTLTDIIPGRTPFFLTFSSPHFDGRRNRRRALEQAAATPTLFWCINNGECSSALTFKLTWDQPTSDLDLHVVEPSGLEVYYGQMTGDFGALDVDDVDGYGPEHYMAPFVEGGQSYVATVHLCNVAEDVLPINFTLEAHHESKVLWIHSRSFVSDNEYSEEFPVTIETDDILCAVCSANSELNGRRNLVDYSQSPGVCTTCMNKWGGWCYIFPYFCDNEDAKESWKLYQTMATMEPTEENISGQIKLILTPFFNKTSHMRAQYETILYGISQKNGNYECLKYQLLNVYCQITSSKDMEFWIKVVARLAAHESTLTAIADVGLITVKTILEFINNEIIFNYLSIDPQNIFKILRDYYSFSDLLLDWGGKVIGSEENGGCGFALT
jgi:hypothetical protein